MSERNELFDQLKRHNESQFEELLLRLKVDKSHIRWSGVTLSQKALDLIAYLEQQEDGLQRLQARLERGKPDNIPLILDCPYRELFAFQEEHAKFFFGRSTFINDLVQAVKTKPLVAVVGASGSGKSSLVFAGLLPRLRQEGSWLIESFRPEKQPFNRLAAAFVHQLEPELGKSDRIDKAINLANTIRQHGFAYVLSEILQEHPGKQLLLVVDQFEELYTVCSEEERDRFIDVLLAGINDSLGLKVVLTLRADFCGQAYTCRSLADALQSADLKLGSMNGEELREAIERPAQLMEVELEEKLTERLLEDVKQEPGNLPLLEFALTELWKKQRQRTLTHQAYAEIGGVAKALANHAETVYAKLNEAQQKQAQRIFLQLVHPGEGTEDTRRLATRGEVGADNWELVTHLAGASARLVVTARNEETQEETVEIVHEALLREWKQLRDWMKSDRTFRIWQEELRSRRRRWQRNEQNEEDLLTGSLLSAAEVWLHERQADLSPKDGEFIRLSVEVRDRRLKREIKQLEKLLEEEEKARLAESKARKAAQMRTRFAVTAAGFALVSVVIGGIAGLKQMELQRATRNLLLGSNLPASELVQKLPSLFEEAKKFKAAGDLDLELAAYRRILDYTSKLQTEKNSDRESWNPKKIQTLSEQATTYLIQAMKPRLHELENYLNKKEFGNPKNSYRFADFEKKFEPGALQTTYKILMREFGAKADLNDDGLITNAEEANRMPCEILRQIQNLWLEATQNRCGWFGSDFRIIDESCVQLKSQTLTSVIFDDPYTFPIERLKSCGIAPK